MWDNELVGWRGLVWGLNSCLTRYHVLSTWLGRKQGFCHSTKSVCNPWNHEKRGASVWNPFVSCMKISLSNSFQQENCRKPTMVLFSRFSVWIFRCSMLLVLPTFHSTFHVCLCISNSRQNCTWHIFTDNFSVLCFRYLFGFQEWFYLSSLFILFFH